MWKIAPLLSSVMILAFSSGQAMAWSAYYLEPGLWAIRCNDGTLHSYSGSGNGLPTVGPALCEDHGGVVGPSDKVTRIEAEKFEVVPVERGQQQDKPKAPHRR
jgi:hypothetical protein